MTYAETAQHGHYVTVRFNSRRWVILADPFVHRRDAEHHIDPARRAAQAATARTARSIDYTFAEYGTARLHFNPGAPLPRGRFNDAIGLDVDPTSGYLSSAQPPQPPEVAPPSPSARRNWRRSLPAWPLRVRGHNYLPRLSLRIRETRAWPSPDLQRRKVSELVVFPNMACGWGLVRVIVVSARMKTGPPV